jgi:uncharacterized RDD family membrane protein YckC
MEERVSFGRRLGAIIIDLLFIVVIGGILGGVVGNFLAGEPMSEPSEHIVSSAGGTIVMYVLILFGIPVFGMCYNLIVGIIWRLGCFWAIGSPKQGLHDMLVKTAVYPRQSL